MPASTTALSPSSYLNVSIYIFALHLPAIFYNSYLLIIYHYNLLIIYHYNFATLVDIDSINLASPLLSFSL